MVAAQTRTPFGEPIRKPPTQTPQRQQQSQPSTNTFAANKNNNNNNGGGGGGGGIRNVGNAGIGPPKPEVGPGAITRRPLAQQRSQLSGNVSTTTGKKKKCFGGGCCKAKKKPGVQKAAPPKEKRGRFSSLFSRNKKAADGSSLKSSKPITTSKPLTPGFSKPGIRSNGQQPPTAAPAQKQPQQLATSRSSTTTAPVQSKQQPKKQQQLPIGAPAAKSSSKDVKSDNKKKDDKKVSSKTDPKKSHQKSLTESPKNHEKELQTGIEDSEKEEIKKPVTKSSSKLVGKDLAYKSWRSFQEVKVSVSNFDNGMTERKVVMTSIYPSNETPPNPFMACSAPATACPRMKKSYTSLKHANSVERLPQSSDDNLLKSPEKPLSPPSSPYCDTYFM